MPPKDNGKGKAAAAPPPYQRVALRGENRLTAAQLAEFHRFMQANNNTFTNAQGQRITFNQGTVVDDMHDSTSMGDPSNLPRIGITLTNDALFRQDGTSHLFHFRPDSPANHYIYPQGYTRTQVTDMVNKRKARRDAKKNQRGGGSGGQGGGRGGGASGAGAGRGNATTGAGRGGSTQTQQQGGRGGSNQTQQQAGRGSGTTGGGRGTTAGKAPPATQGKKK